MSKKKNKKKNKKQSSVISLMQKSPFSLINGLSTLISKYVEITWENGLEAKDVLIMSRFLHLGVCAKLDLDEDEVSEAFEIINDMTHEEEFVRALELGMIPDNNISRSLTLKSNIPIDEV